MKAENDDGERILLGRMKLQKNSLLIFASIGLVVSVYFVVLFQGEVYLDRIFLPDDTYYTLSIARNMALGNGPSVDGVHLTSGFQPLIAFLLVPFFKMMSNGAQVVLVAIGLSALFGFINACLVGALVYRISGMFGAAMHMALFAALSPAVLLNNFNGLETSIAAMFALLSLYILHGVINGAGYWSCVLLGLAVGFSILARVDNAIVALVIGFICVRHLSWVRVGCVVLVAFVVVLPWWVYSLENFHTIIPESGPAVREIVLFHKDLHLDTARILSFAWQSMVVVFPSGFGWARHCLLLLVTAFAFVCLKDALSSSRQGVAGATVLVAVLVGGFYVFYLPAFWFFGRYLNLVFLALIIVLGGRIYPALVEAGDRYQFVHARKILNALSFTLLVGCLVSLVPLLSKPQSSLLTGAQGARGYGEVAQEVISAVPDGAVLSAMQSGALAFYAERGIRVVNLDGVVNRNALPAIRSNQLFNYLAAEGVTHYTDWAFNVWAFNHYLGRSVGSSFLTPIMKAKPQGQDQFVLFRIDTSLFDEEKR